MKTRQLFNHCLTPLLSLILLMGASVGGAHAVQPNERQAKAMAMWQERCKTSGEKIYKTVENVEGVYLLKIRPTKVNFANQFELSDPYGDDTGGDGYIKSFLLGQALTANRQVGIVVNGYRYVELLDSKDGQRYRYTGGMKVTGRKDESAPNVQIYLKRDPNYDLNTYRFALYRLPATGNPPRYGVTYEDISTREEREYWIAGSSLKVIDLQSDEVIAERIGYMVDGGQGSQGGGRSPWLVARYSACPKFPGQQTVQIHQTRNFVLKVLKPIQEK